MTKHVRIRGGKKVTMEAGNTAVYTKVREVDETEANGGHEPGQPPSPPPPKKKGRKKSG